MKIDKVAEFLCEYQDLFPTNFAELKGIIGYLGIMKIMLKPDVKLVEKRPYVNLKYKEYV